MGQVLHLWKEWGIQVLVLFSFTLQIMLLIMAELRRRIDFGVLRAFVWSAYMLADATAIYVLGHMSAVSRSPEHELVAFWAPFLLLHLGGQDNITACSLEDTKLWLRHLQTLAVQVAAAAYVVYASSSIPAGGGGSLLRAATVLMFVVGVVKYGERVWALSRPDTEDLLLDAHLFLDVPMELMRSIRRDEVVYFSALDEHALEEVAQMQLSLMHDVFYTKAEVVHSWCGLCVRLVSLPGTAGALVLFSLLGDRRMDSYSRWELKNRRLSYAVPDLGWRYRPELVLPS
ncbi:Protein of unknown function (DUF594 [Striga hermonthica]|uniref:DUF4220 domain-containing protein n=1 Tax=Striga hermonthica TaxID=68872 RepID=A0A9N7NII7_STRHE|nr:Protein of unknown function (DUF594 [Striga hermonthica]